MIKGSATHIIFLLITITFFVLGSIFIRKLPRKVQTIIFIVISFLCSAGIFYRYGLNYFKGFTPKTLGMQMLQVCNFNMILVILMLIPKNELAKQYAFLFSMFAAATTLVSLSTAWKTLKWYDPVVLNSWLNHTFAIALPLFMFSCGRIKLNYKCILPVVICFILYFTGSYIIQLILINKNLLNLNNSYSFIFRTEGIGLLDQLYKWIPHPYFYLMPILPLFVGWCFGIVALYNLVQKKKNKKQNKATL